MYTLVLKNTSGKNPDITFKLSLNSRLVIGREGQDIILGDLPPFDERIDVLRKFNFNYVSATHLIVTLDKVITLINMSRRGFTFVNGIKLRPLEEKNLQDGDIVCLHGKKVTKEGDEEFQEKKTSPMRYQVSILQKKVLFAENSKVIYFGTEESILEQRYIRGKVTYDTPKTDPNSTKKPLKRVRMDDGFQALVKTNVQEIRNKKQRMESDSGGVQCDQCCRVRDEHQKNRVRILGGSAKEMGQNKCCQQCRQMSLDP